MVPLGGYAIFAAPSVISNPPYSSVAWYNGTAALQSGGRVGIAPSALTISNVQATDAGTYEYTVTNSYGTSNIYGSLSIGTCIPRGVVRDRPVHDAKKKKNFKRAAI